MKRFSSLLLLVASLSLILSACVRESPNVIVVTPYPTQAVAAPTGDSSGPVIEATNSGEAIASADTTAATVIAPAERPILDITYENALAPRLLLSFGALKLAETSTPITIDQAPQLLMLWQALSNLTASGTGATEEITALLTQIEQTMTPEQIMAINAMKLSQTEMQTWAQANGITMGSGSGTGTGMGQGKNLSPEARATRQAANGMTGQVPGGENGLSGAITTALIAYLQTIQ